MQRLQWNSCSIKATWFWSHKVLIAWKQTYMRSWTGIPIRRNCSLLIVIISEWAIVIHLPNIRLGHLKPLFLGEDSPKQWNSTQDTMFLVVVLESRTLSKSYQDSECYDLPTWSKLNKFISISPKKTHTETNPFHPKSPAQSSCCKDVSPLQHSWRTVRHVATSWDVAWSPFFFG